MAGLLLLSRSAFRDGPREGREVATPLLVVGVRVEGGAGRREQDRLAPLARALRRAGPRSPSSPTARSGRRRQARARSSPPPLRSSGRRARRARRRVRATGSRRACRGRRGSGGRSPPRSPRGTCASRPRWCPSSRPPSGRPAPRRRARLRCGSPAKALQTFADRVARRPEALGGGDRRERVLHVVRARGARARRPAARRPALRRPPSGSSPPRPTRRPRRAPPGRRGRGGPASRAAARAGCRR